MKVRIALFILSAAATLGVSAHGVFTPLAGNSAGCSFSVESSISGYATSSDGSTVSHGTLMPTVVGTSGCADIITCPASSQAAVYNAEGLFLGTFPADKIESADFLPGVYIIYMNGEAKKIVKLAR